MGSTELRPGRSSVLIGAGNVVGIDPHNGHADDNGCRRALGDRCW